MRWSAQARLMRHDIVETPVSRLGQECRRLLEAAKRTVRRSFLCLRFVVSRSVMLAELSCDICGGIVRCRRCMRVDVNVVACSENYYFY